MGGSYPEAVVLRSGVSLYGGYAPSGTRSPTGATTITAPEGAAQTLLADVARGVELQLLDVRGPDRSGAGAGASSYAIRAVSEASLAVSGVTARGRTAAAGANGTPGTVDHPIARRTLPRSHTLCLPPGAARAQRCRG